MHSPMSRVTAKTACLLNIEAPVIAAINGPAWRHREIPLLSDIVLAADTAAFQDSAHFPNGLVLGDGMHIVMPLLLGMNRGRYFLLTGQTLSAQEARDWSDGEVLPHDKVLACACRDGRPGADGTNWSTEIEPYRNA